MKEQTIALGFWKLRNDPLGLCLSLPLLPKTKACLFMLKWMLSETFRFLQEQLVALLLLTFYPDDWIKICVDGAYEDGHASYGGYFSWTGCLDSIPHPTIVEANACYFGYGCNSVVLLFCTLVKKYFCLLVRKSLWYFWALLFEHLFICL